MGPLFNDVSCVNCHKGPVTGGGSATLETRAGKIVNGQFVEHPGGSLVRDHVISACPQYQQHVFEGEVSTKRASVNTLGDGFIEAIADETIVDISLSQPPDVRGLVIQVPVLEAPGSTRVGRFGWKNQHGSLVSFAADAYVNEMGITSSLEPVEPTSDGNSVSSCETPSVEDKNNDVAKFADFMRATKVPPRAQISENSQGDEDDDNAGEEIFHRIGCATCHVGAIRTAPVGTAINGGTFRVPPALGNKIIHPFSDFLLHDVGTSDPIVQNGGQATFNKVRTPPLWGVRTRTRLMHDGQSTNFTDAIERHGGQAAEASSIFRSLPQEERQRLLVFLGSL